jgi:hypothetical protein
MTEITGTQIPEVFRWIAATLNDATLNAAVPGGWHEHPAPEGTAFVYGTVQVQAPEDLDVVGGHRVWEELLVLLRVIAKGRDTLALKPAVDRMDALLQRGSGTTAGGRVLSCVRVSPFYLPEASQGQHYRHLGGLYRILAQPLNT